MAISGLVINYFSDAGKLVTGYKASITIKLVIFNTMLKIKLILEAELDIPKTGWKQGDLASLLMMYLTLQAVYNCV